MKVFFLTESSSWIYEHAARYASMIQSESLVIKIIEKEMQVESCDLLFILGYGKLINKSFLDIAKYSLVVHESDLPRGRGWSPLSWQVLEGKTTIPITLFMADSKIDSGLILKSDVIRLDGNELVAELRLKQWEGTQRLIEFAISQYPNYTFKEQVGDPTHYRRRTPKDSELDINQSILAQFNLLRIADNERYPAFFIVNEQKYILKIYKENNDD